MKRVVILGRGAAGKSMVAARLGQVTGLSVIELDRHFWKPGPNATPPAEWAHAQSELLQREAWIMDGDRPSGGSLRTQQTTASLVHDL